MSHLLREWLYITAALLIFVLVSFLIAWVRQWWRWRKEMRRRSGVIGMIGFWTRLWCALRDHPYPLVFVGGREAYMDWIEGRDPFCPNRMCSHCGKEFKYRKGGMAS